MKTSLIEKLLEVEPAWSRFSALDKIWSYENIDEIIQKLNSGIHAPFLHFSKSMLGGRDRASIAIALSLDPKNTWKNNIFENSRYARFFFEMNGTINQISGYGTSKFRKIRVSSVEAAIAKINAFVQANANPAG